jgi:hypothetical protein
MTDQVGATSGVEPSGIEPSTEFEIGGTPNMKLYGGVLAVLGLGIIGFTAAAMTAGSAGPRALIPCAATLALLLAIYWNLRRTSGGVVIATERGLTVRRDWSVGRQQYKWQDISDVQSDGDETSGAINLLLARSPRLSLIPGRGGTDTLGVPLLRGKTVRLELEDPEAFMTAVLGHLHKIRHPSA